MNAERRLLAGLWVVWALLCCLLSMGAFDIAVSNAMRDLPPDVVGVFRAITVAGLGQWYLWPTGLGALALVVAGVMTDDPARAAHYRRLAWALAFVFAAVLLSGLVADVIKLLAGRARPKLLAEAGVFGFEPLGLHADRQSFPSGHATTAAALAAALAWLGVVWRGPLVAFALVIAASRVVINAHYLSDVIAGLSIGWVVTWALRECFAAHRVVFEPEPDGEGSG